MPNDARGLRIPQDLSGSLGNFREIPVPGKFLVPLLGSPWRVEASPAEGEAAHGEAGHLCLCPELSGPRAEPRAAHRARIS